MYNHHTWRRWQWSVPLKMFCPLLEIPGFHLTRIWSDAMHCLDLGISQFTIASAVWEISELPSGAFPGATREQRLQQMYEHYRMWCLTHGLERRGKEFRPNHFKSSNKIWPQLNQQLFKAAGIRQLVYWIKDVCGIDEFCRDQYGRIRFAMFLAFVAGAHINYKVIVRRTP